LRSPDLALLAVGLIAIASIGKFLGAFIGGTIGGLSRAESLAVGCGMNARGSTEVIVATLGLSSGLLSLVVGIADTRDPTGGFSEDLSLITHGFDGPLAVVDTRSPRHELAKERHGRVLIPVNGTDVSRRAVEVELTLARASDAHVTALYVTRASASPATSPPRRLVMRRNESGVLKDIAALAERYDVPLRNTTRADMAPDQAILREASRGYDLVVLGVSRRPGDMLFFGNTAAAVLERSPTSILFVAS
jgi:nucleotide-binding universal stress UspA family protein